MATQFGGGGQPPNPFDRSAWQRYYSTQGRSATPTATGTPASPGGRASGDSGGTASLATTPQTAGYWTPERMASAQPMYVTPPPGWTPQPIYSGISPHSGVPFGQYQALVNALARIQANGGYGGSVPWQQAPQPQWWNSGGYNVVPAIQNQLAQLNNGGYNMVPAVQGMLGQLNNGGYGYKPGPTDLTQPLTDKGMNYYGGGPTWTNPSPGYQGPTDITQPLTDMTMGYYK